MSKLLVLALFFHCCFGQNGPVVKLQQGSILGKSDTSRGGLEYKEFLGIPYGKVKERFLDSEPADAWKDTHDGREPGDVCLQDNIFIGKMIGSEDCLTVNVHTPKLPDQSNMTSSDLLPVLVFIHGGVFAVGSGKSYGPKYFMDKGILLVTINYRLGPFGFLNAGTPHAKGNQGMKDQVLALKWVKNNIMHFGGDPNRVTISGESAGAASVSLLVLSPMAKGLFIGAISQSGTATCPWIHEWFSQHATHAKKLAVSVDCPTSDKEYMVNCLKKIDAKYLLKNNVLDWGIRNDEWKSRFGPTLDYKGPGSNSSTIFLPDSPSALIATDRIASKVPYIIGANSHEGFFFMGGSQVLLNENVTKEYNNEFGRIAPYTFMFTLRARDPCEIASRIKSFYFNNTNVSIDNMESLNNLYGDVYFTLCGRSLAMSHSKVAPTYLYFFKKDGTLSLTDAYNNWPHKSTSGKKRATHGDELQYLFNIPEFFGNVSQIDSMKFSEDMTELWASFVKNGKPTHPSGVKWDAVSLSPGNEAPKWFVIDDVNVMNTEDEDITKRAKFWEELPFKNENEI